MHYKNGREAKVGDKIVGKDIYTGNPFSGIVGFAHAGSDTCNLTVYPLMATDQMSATAKDCLHIEDVLPAPAKF